MFDCYRPERAVADMVAWAQNGRETSAEHRYNPAFSKPDLFRLGYIAEPFPAFHRRSARPDAGRSDRRQFRSVRSEQGLRRLHRAAVARAPEGSVDMGTGYDCSDVKAHTAASLDHAGAAALAQAAGGCDGEARLCELFEGMVAFFAAGGGPAGL